MTFSCEKSRPATRFRELLTELQKTREQQLAQDLRLSEERFRTFMDNAPYLTFIKDEDGRFLYYNRRMAERFSISGDEWIGKNDFEIWPESIAQKMHRNDEDVIRGGVPVDRLEATVDESGNTTTWKVHKFIWRDELGRVRLGGIGVDLSEELAREKALAEANLKLQRLAALDTLTGLANRRILDERMESELKVARRNQTELSVVMFDIDNFKQRNDLYGHAAGDRVLEQLGRILTSTLRDTDLAARYGGEEFVVLLPGAGPKGVKIFAERLRERILEAEWPNEPLTASFGIASLDPMDATGSPTWLIDTADRAMYEAKRAGKNRVMAGRHIGPQGDAEPAQKQLV
jgi:diguanylate cyclase (GGDEF)-like protein/PAS domain S-box-containing protein